MLGRSGRWLIEGGWTRRKWIIGVELNVMPLQWEDDGEGRKSSFKNIPPLSLYRRTDGERGGRAARREAIEPFPELDATLMHLNSYAVEGVRFLSPGLTRGDGGRSRG